jgi:hypothetical protein
MPIKSIVIEIEPAAVSENKVNRILRFSRETRLWTCDDGGLFSGEISLINAFNKVKQDIQV